MAINKSKNKKTKTRKNAVKRKISKKKTTTEKKTQTKIFDKDLRKLQKDLMKSREKSTLIEKDILKLKDQLRLKGPAEIVPKKKSKAEPAIFYKKFIFKCGKCVGEFKHTARVPMIRYVVVCPVCKEEHVLKIKPLADGCEVKLPRSIKLIK